MNLNKKGSLVSHHLSTMRKVEKVSVRLAGSNSPCEDRYAVRIRDDMQAFTVIDGHGGNLAADITCTRLLDMIFDKVGELPKDARSADKIAAILDETFVACDKMVLDEAIRIKTLRQNNADLAAMGQGGAGAGAGAGAGGSQLSSSRVKSNSNGRAPPKPTGRAGCCVLVLLILDGIMYYAHIGDCRAVLAHDEPSASPVRLASKKARTETGAAVTATAATATASAAANNASCNTVSGFYYKDYHIESRLQQPLTGAPSDNSKQQQQAEMANQSLKRTREAESDYFRYRSRGIEVSAVTCDHSCDSQIETEAIRLVTTDADPIRVSINGKLSKKYTAAPLRVAGSLAVTRAMGDGYLKMESLSVRPYKDYCPYITSRPTISWREVRPSDRSIILASDGLWNFVTARECASVLGPSSSSSSSSSGGGKGVVRLPGALSFVSHEPQDLSIAEGVTYVLTEGADIGIPDNDDDSDNNDGDGDGTASSETERKGGSHNNDDTVFKPSSSQSSPSTAAIAAKAKQQQQQQGGANHNPQQDEDPAGQLLEICLRNAATNSKTSLQKLRDMEAGDARRMLVDDITVMVLHLAGGRDGRDEGDEGDE
jgi:serine/threonine protein phosphatase PrpC